MDGFDWSSFVEVPGFTARWHDVGCDDADLRELQMGLLKSPTRWPVVPGTGGWRKARFAPSSKRRGKSGAFRVYYADLPDAGFVLLGTVFAKSEASDLRAKDKKELAALLIVYHRILKRS